MQDLPLLPEQTPADKITAADICAALERRYNQASQGHDNEAWIMLHEARSGAGFAGNDGACDFLAINTWQSRGMQIIGHEIKVSVADLRVELANPHKAERFAQHCHRWWMVMPSKLATTHGDDVPPAWGILTLARPGARLRVVRQASLRHDVTDVPVWWWVGWMAQIDRQHKRAARRIDGRERDRLVEQEVERRMAATGKGVDVSAAHWNDLKVAHDRNVEAFGVDLSRVHPATIAQIKTLLSLDRTHGLVTSAMLTSMAERLNEVARALEAP